MFSQIAILSKEDHEFGGRASELLATKLSALKAKVYRDLENLPADLDLAICIGGDGTLLSKLRRLGGLRHKVMVLGVHGSKGLGFLHALKIPETGEGLEPWADQVVKMLATEKYVGETRWGLQAEISGAPHNGEKLWALNDIVISKGSLSRLVEIKVFVGDEPLYPRLRGDGLIVSSSTGSTGYALSAGGPVMDPILQALLLTPICPHTVSQRPILFGSDKKIRVELTHRNTPCTVTADGQEGRDMTGSNKLIITQAEEPIHFLRPLQKTAFQDHLKVSSYYETLHKKLGFGGD